MHALQRRRLDVRIREKAEALAALPCFQEGLDHIRSVIASTQATRSTVFRLFLAIQRYALTHPSWDPSTEALDQFPKLVS